MFNIGMMELLLVLLVAFVVVGPRDLPKVARWIARQVKALRKLVREVKKDTGWDELAKEFKDTRDDVQETLKEADVRSELKTAADQVNAEVKNVQQEVKQAAETLKQEAEQ
ncbi:MAG: twin-arginine translocase TatA/TatE family subunit [Clostridia bacterium]|nr:twin-arginine translocase TatA/TatE family subunit [Clostridia bacterium]